MTSSTIIDCKITTVTRNTTTPSQRPVSNKSSSRAFTETGQQSIIEDGENIGDADKTTSQNAQQTVVPEEQKDCEFMWLFFVRFLDRLFLCVFILLEVSALVALSLNVLFG